VAKRLGDGSDTCGRQRENVLCADARRKIRLPNLEDAKSILPLRSLLVVTQLPASFRPTTLTDEGKFLSSVDNQAGYLQGLPAGAPGLGIPRGVAQRAEAIPPLRGAGDGPQEAALDKPAFPVPTRVAVPYLAAGVPKARRITFSSLARREDSGRPGSTPFSIGWPCVLTVDLPPIRTGFLMSY